MARKSKYNLALEVTADTSKASREINALAARTRSRFARQSLLGVRLEEPLKRALGGLSSGIGSAVGQLQTGFTAALGIARKIQSSFGTIAKLGLTGAALIGGGIFAANKLLGPAEQKERRQTTLGAIGKGQLFDFLNQASAGRPFKSSQTTEAGILLESFGLSSKKFIDPIIDAASVFKKDLTEVARAFGFAKGGRSGEALESAVRFGVTRKDLESIAGVQFRKSGEVIDKDGLADAMRKVILTKFGGAGERIGTQTFSGAKSDLGDTIEKAFQGLQPLLETAATPIIRGLSKTVGLFGQFIRDNADTISTIGDQIRNGFAIGKAIIDASFQDGGRRFFKFISASIDILLTMGPKFFTAAIADGGTLAANIMRDMLANPSTWKGLAKGVYQGTLGVGTGIVGTVLTTPTKLMAEGAKLFSDKPENIDDAQKQFEEYVGRAARGGVQLASLNLSGALDIAEGRGSKGAFAGTLNAAGVGLDMLERAAGDSFGKQIDAVRASLAEIKNSLDKGNEANDAGNMAINEEIKKTNEIWTNTAAVVSGF